MKLTLFIMALFILPAVYAQSPQEDQSTVNSDSIVHARKYEASRQHQNVPARVHSIKKPFTVNSLSQVNGNQEDQSNSSVADTTKTYIKPLTEASRSRKIQNSPALPFLQK